MRLKDIKGVAGRLEITLTRASGQTEVVHVENLVVDTGLNYIVSRMMDASLPVMSHIGVGEGLTPSAHEDTTLEAEIGRAALSSTAVEDNKIVYAVTFVPGVATGAITEAGIFNDATDGVMLSRTVFPVINKQISDTMSISWTVTVEDAGE